LEGGSFDEVLVELNRFPADDHEGVIRQSRDDSLNKLRDIEQLVEGWDRSRPEKELADLIQKIISGNGRLEHQYIVRNK
jgi:hypothetical protein